MTTRKVFIFQRTVTDYRVPLFDILATKLLEHDIDLCVLTGHAEKRDYFHNEEIKRPWLTYTDTRKLPLALYYHKGFVSLCRSADMIILEQSNKLLPSYFFILNKCFRTQAPLVAFWGHGVDFSDQRSFSPRRLWKRAWMTAVDHWFAYTEITAQILSRVGYPPTQTTILNNASNTEGLSKAVESILVSEQDALFSSLWKEDRLPTHQVGIFCSRLLPSKKLRFLLEASKHIVDANPNFRLLIIGDGPLRFYVDSVSKSHFWCAYLPSVYGIHRAPYLALADIWVNPGTTGLAILDAYAAGIPFMTCDIPGHGPEIAYLDSSAGGMSPDDTTAFSDMVCEMLADEKQLLAKKSAAKKLGAVYTLEEMADRFTQGILACLKSRN